VSIIRLNITEIAQQAAINALNVSINLLNISDLIEGAAEAYLNTTETFTAPITFSQPITSTAPGSQIVFDWYGNQTTLTIDVPIMSGSYKYHLGDAGKDTTIMMLDGNQVVNDIITLKKSPVLQGNSYQLDLQPQGVGNHIFIYSDSPTQNLYYRIDDEAANASFVMRDTGDIIKGNIIFTGNITYVGGFTTVSNMQGNTTTLLLTGAIDQIQFQPLGTGSVFSFNVVSPSTNVTVNFPDPMVDCDALYTRSVQIVYDTKIFAASIKSTAPTPQLQFQINNTGPSTYISFQKTLQNLYYSVDDVGVNTSFAMVNGAQTLTDKSITSPAITGTVTGSATFNTVTLTSPTINSATMSGTTITSGQEIYTAVSNQIEFKPGNGPSFTIFNVPIPTTGNWTISFQDPTQNTNVAYTDSAQTLNTKTLPSPVISGTVTGGAVYNSVTLVTPIVSGTETITGKLLMTIPSNQFEFRASNGPSYTMISIPTPTTGNWTISFQDSTQNTNVAYTDSAQTLNTKTLPSPVISGTVTGGATYNSVTLVTPTITGVETLTGQLLLTVASSQIEFKPSNGPSFTIFNVPIPTTGNWTISFQDPTQNTNVVYTDSAQTLNSKTLATSTTISGTLSVTAATIFVAGHTVALAGANTVTGGITFSGNVKFSSPTYLFLWNQDGLSNGFVVSMDALAAQRFLNFPDPTVDTNVAYTDGPQTFTSKTLSSPAITGTVTGGATYSGASLSSPAITGTVTGSASYSSVTLSGTTTASGQLLSTVASNQFKFKPSNGPSFTTVTVPVPTTGNWTITMQDPTLNTNFAYTDGPQTFTSKTLTSPTITNPSITGTVTGGGTYSSITATSPTISGTVAGSASYTSPTLSGTVSVTGAATFSSTATFNGNVVTQGVRYPNDGISNAAFLTYFIFDTGTTIVQWDVKPTGFPSAPNVYIQRIGKMTTIMFDAVSATCTGSGIVCANTHGLAFNYRMNGKLGSGPTDAQIFSQPIIVLNGGGEQYGLVQTDASGVVCIYGGQTGGNFIAGTCGYNAFSMTFATNGLNL
jgi:hypothetical protein